MSRRAVKRESDTVDINAMPRSGSRHLTSLCTTASADLALGDMPPARRRLSRLSAPATTDLYQDDPALQLDHQFHIQLSLHLRDVAVVASPMHHRQ